MNKTEAIVIAVAATLALAGVVTHSMAAKSRDIGACAVPMYQVDRREDQDR